MLCGWEGNRRPAKNKGSLRPVSAPGPMLANKYGKPLPFYLRMVEQRFNLKSLLFGCNLQILQDSDTVLSFCL